jgi:CRP-like cAMP-binding protein
MPVYISIMTGYILKVTVIYTQHKERRNTTMTEKQIKQIENQLPQGEKIDRMYSAFEGEIRVITKNADGCEIRYSASFDADDNASIKRF